MLRAILTLILGALISFVFIGLLYATNAKLKDCNGCKDANTTRVVTIVKEVNISDGYKDKFLKLSNDYKKLQKKAKDDLRWTRVWYEKKIKKMKKCYTKKINECNDRKPIDCFCIEK